ncbi:hypothetical protein MBOVJF4428_00214 [Mycoplasmopsis agalactiae]|uniref:Uncharacterized protein n=1 Tax=Mycoplasmopsis agalactiae (strain NCTC 10123 / CIP 59.7 / PG2) TaxID=347257 RepID=A5IYJ7_MYCAP|nr:hypothetical protein [Mycoplasmopsis agalactiae]MCE6057159.1 hypothetical protein [Mycoplasmopsis agalactiae]MCE6078946.1 hypothetical protein [Mycoplasmopsis agalactiae]MCE6095331.1 hypothetical protein [Mycoplasmopsis agalactiae]MCE6114588.1 hypothetical protein [Mycoplasmopsis agalactiae]NLS34572.1 hypothetical protein [Mycoplasmopsis agalactiae]
MNNYFYNPCQADTNNSVPYQSNDNYDKKPEKILDARKDALSVALIYWSIICAFSLAMAAGIQTIFEIKKLQQANINKPSLRILFYFLAYLWAAISTFLSYQILRKKHRYNRDFIIFTRAITAPLLISFALSIPLNLIFYLIVKKHCKYGAR